MTNFLKVLATDKANGIKTVLIGINPINAYDAQGKKTVVYKDTAIRYQVSTTSLPICTPTKLYDTLWYAESQVTTIKKAKELLAKAEIAYGVASQNPAKNTEGTRMVAFRIGQNIHCVFLNKKGHIDLIEDYDKNLPDFWNRVEEIGLRYDRRLTVNPTYPPEKNIKNICDYLMCR